MPVRTLRIAIALVASVALLGVLFAFRAPLLRASIAAVIDLASGYQVSFNELALGRGGATLRGVHLSHAGEAVLDADLARVRYRLRDLLPGGAHRYGLLSVELDRPRLQLLRHTDGSFNVSGSAASEGGPRAPASSAAGTPLAFTAAVRDGSVVIVDPNRRLPIARRIEIDDLNGSATVNSAARTSYRFSGSLGSVAAQPFSASGRIDPSGYAIHRIVARAVAVAPIADYFINTRSAEVLAGTAHDLDVRVYSFGPGDDGNATYHIAGSGLLANGSIHLPGFAVPATAMSGRIDVSDDALLAPQLTARLGPLSVRVAGGLYDREAPAFRLGILAAHAPLENARMLFRFSHRLPLSGDAQLSTLLESAVGAPLVATNVAAPYPAYGAFPIARVSGRAIYYAGAVDVVGAAGNYGGLDVTANGAVDLGDVIHTQLVVDARGPAARIPYAAQVAPRATLHATALLAGDALRIDARGVADGSGGGTTLAGLLHVDPDGEGAFGPLAVSRADGGEAEGTFFLDRRASRSGFWLSAHDYPIARLPNDPRLPGISLAPPIFGARVDGTLAGIGPPSDFRIAGVLRARGLETEGVRIDEVSGTLAGRFANLRLGGVAARGPWGTFRGTGAYLGNTLALAGNYRGSFARLRGFTGDLGASGSIDGPVALLISPERMVVQARGDATRGATVRGVPVDHLSGTLGVSQRVVRVYSATARVAGGTFAAAGYVDARRGVGVSVAGADASRLREIAPLGAGRIDAIGSFRSLAKATRFDGGLAVGEATLDRLPLSANGDLTLAGSRLNVSATDAVIGPAFGALDGSLAGLGSHNPRYDLGVHLAALRLAPFARAVAPERRDITGTLDGDMRVRGTAAALSVSGNIEMPEGTVNGLAFRDLASGFALTPGGVSVSRGRVIVGTTVTNFSGAVAGADAAFRVDAAAADLADFNDLFDAGDTLGGSGRVGARFLKNGESVRTSADIAIAGLHYRRFDLGDATARWTSRGRDVTGNVAFGGTSGTLTVSGTVALAPRAPLMKLVERSRFNGTAQLRGLDLGVWLPALGYQLPVDGRVDADATIGGGLENPLLRTTASLVGGSLGRFPVDRLELAATSTLRRTTITSVSIDLPEVSLSGSGSFGPAATDPVTFGMHFKSANVGAIAARMLGAKTPLTGAAELDLKVDGTRAHPRVAGGFDLENATLHGVAIPQALGEFSIAGRDVVLSDAEIAFAKGTLYLAGSVPLQIAPFGFGPAAAPITLDLNAKGIDLSNFTPLLPADSTLQGAVDGHVAIGGTAGNPRLDGSLELAGGQFRAPFETVPLQNVAAKLGFAGNAATLESLQATAGGGSLAASGNVRFANLVRPSTDAAYHFEARATHLGLALPDYGTGTVDGTLTLTHIPQTLPRLVGNLALNDSAIPFSALLLFGGATGGGFDAAAPTAAAAAVSPDSEIALDLELAAQRNVRVHSANVDIGARGDLHVSGTRSSPALTGEFDSTGGTLAYFNTVFRLIEGKVTFEPDLGVIPNLDARAVTHVLNPDPNTIRNLSGSADVTLDVHGPVTNLTIALSSDPAYERQQILGLLLNAPALGASNLFGRTDQPTLYGTTAANLPPGAVSRAPNGEFSVAQEAFGIANAQFTRTLLAPIESTVAEAVGLTNIDVNVDYAGNVGLTARKILGKKVNAIYGTTFGYPYRQTFGFEIKPNASTAAQVTVFQTLGAYGLNSLTPTSFLSPSNLKLQEAEPSQGTAGFSLSLQHLF